MPGSMPFVIRVLIHAYADDRHDTVHVYLGDTAASARTCTARSRLARPCRSSSPSGSAASPSTPPPGLLAGRRRRAARLQRVPVPAAAGGHRRRHARARRAQPLPRPDQLGAAQGAQRPLRGPVHRIAIGNGSCDILLAAGEALLEPGRRGDLRLAELQRLPAPRGGDGGAGDRGAGRRRPPPRPRADARRDHGRDAARDRLQPEQPDLDRPAARGDRGLRARGAAPRRRDPRRGLLRVQPAPGPRRLARPARPAPEPRPPAHLLQGLRPVRPARRLRRCAARTTSAPRSTRCASRSSATPPRRPRRSRRSAPGRGRRAAWSATSPSGSSSRTGCARLGLEPAESQANFVWFDLPDGDRRARRRARRWPSAGCSSAPARRSAAPGALRVTVGSEGENPRFLEALGTLLAQSPRATSSQRRLDRTLAGCSATMSTRAGPRRRPS